MQPARIGAISCLDLTGSLSSRLLSDGFRRKQSPDGWKTICEDLNGSIDAVLAEPSVEKNAEARHDSGTIGPRVWSSTRIAHALRWGTAIVAVAVGLSSTRLSQIEGVNTWTAPWVIDLVPIVFTLAAFLLGDKVTKRVAVRFAETLLDSTHSPESPSIDKHLGENRRRAH